MVRNHSDPIYDFRNNGTSFTSEEFTTFLIRNGIQYVRTPPYHPASYGMAERGVQMAKNALQRISGQNVD
ncbi:hypothetical protein PR048_033653 [Dryococelus australis]|uniref:Integrase catalytic domain-containing protein n=1 Tax=Dryococelus australis TaxID=614101 RepID=A0ABQ9G4Z9_9NEOP|nr:hypothetical protein PR048_033653 [Dryococelus australis]